MEGRTLSLRDSRYIKQLQPITLPISSIKGVGPKRALHFARKGIHTILDLFFFTPLRYDGSRSVSENPDAAIKSFA